jgi:Fe-S-cluster containining protein
MNADRVVHPCRRCGACCATYQVSFYWAEADARNLPEGMVVPVGRLRLAMAGTDRGRPRCDALMGDLGGSVACSLYDRRPSPCRELTPSWARGAAEEGCDRARVRHGLAPLSPADWLGIEPDEPERPEPERPDGPDTPEPERPIDPKVPSVA